MLAMREFDWSYELGMYAGTAAGLIAVAFVASGLFWLIRSLFRSSRS
jgi:hypothetical protein